MKAYFFWFSLLMISLTQLTYAAEEERPFIITIEIPEDSKDFFVKIKGDVNGSGASDYTIDWGDGTTTSGGSSSEETVNHTYATAGEYQVSMSGKLPQLTFSNFSYAPDDSEKINASRVKRVEQWGTNKWYSTGYMFKSASNLLEMTEEKPDFSKVEMMNSMFSEATNFNQDLNSWDVSNVTNLAFMFRDAISFNGDISSWDVGAVTNMPGMFDGALAFNRELKDWDVSNVIDMSFMFANTRDFNQDIGMWNVGSVKRMPLMFSASNAFNGDLNQWNVSEVEDLSEMFSFSKNFNGDLSNWNLASAEYMGSMFRFAEKFNQDLSSWKISNVKNLAFMFENTQDYSPYLSDKLWDSWFRQELNENVRFYAPKYYCNDLSLEKRQIIIDNNFWDISEIIKECGKIVYCFKEEKINSDTLLLFLGHLSGKLKEPSFYPQKEGAEFLGWSIDLDNYPIVLWDFDQNTFTEDETNLYPVFFTESFPPSGEGTESNPYLISNLAELRWLSEGLEGGLSDAERWQAGTYYELSQNIDAIESRIWNEGKGFAPIGNEEVSFRAHFNGNGFSIQSLRIDDSNRDNIGFFGRTTGADIRNLSLKDYNINGGTGVGVVGNAYTTAIENIKVEGYLQGNDRLGGVAGVLINSKVSDAKAQVELNGTNEVGGLVGYANYVWGAGGYSTDIRNASAHGIINASSYVGGLVGDAQNANIVNSYSNVYIKAISNVGGVVARNNAGRTAHVYAAGLIKASGSNIGGVVGVNTTGLLVENAYWDKETTGQSSSPGSNASAGLATVDFQLQSNFNGWDFENLWGIGSDGENIRPFFQKDLIAITVSKEGNGNIEGPLFATAGTAVTLKVVPEEFYEIDQILVDGETREWDEQNEFMIANIQQEVQVNVRFKLKSYIVTATVNEGATISPEEISVTHGEDQNFTLTMPEDYEVVDWKVNGFSQGHYSKDFLLENVTEETTVEAEVVQTFAFTKDAGDHGVISPFIDRIRKGSQLSIQIYALEDYLLTDVLINGESVGAVNYYDIYPVVEAVDVKAIIVPAAYQITVSQTENGTISPETTSVAFGDSQTFTVTPDTYYKIVDVLVEGESVGAVSTYTFENVVEDYTITALFDRILSNELQTEIKFYPNPSQGQVFIEGLQTTGEVRILDLSGRVVLETKVSEVASQFDISALGTGIYQLVINGQVIGKLMKE
ncbi:BspA family leucine-rich repeat surface protein [Persicobacter diffluens]|uniref:PKD domain-containing protein n=1 Tax=Persicobacter diffluens TaxID=981 RepID=A0AAN5AIY5_9BACT|nr:hypothetical protein PEDI_15820 [Persicobacter diffluens]